MLFPDIPRGSTWQPQHKTGCLYRYITSQPKADRVAFYEYVAKHHGKDAARELHKRVVEWAAR